jgi:hypothetical protein
MFRFTTRKFMANSHSPGREYLPDRFKIICNIIFCSLVYYGLTEMYEMMYRGGLGPSGKGVAGHEQYFFGSPESKEREFMRMVEERKQMQEEYAAKKKKNAAQ